MASKKILLEVLSPNGPRGAAPPPRPRREERRRERSSRPFRPVPIPVPSTQAILLVLAGAVGVVTAYFVGYWRGTSRHETAPTIQTKAADPLSEVSDEAPPPKAVERAAVERAAVPPAAEKPAQRFGVQMVSYEAGRKNEDLAKRTRDELLKLGLPDVVAWEETAARGGGYFITAGSFVSRDDSGLRDLLERVKALPFGREKAPFSGARIRELQ